jgi:hypothetical protein
MPYLEIHLSDLIAQCGGREAILGHDNPYSFMIQKQEELIKEKLADGYDEVGELHPETIQDYVDAIIEEESYRV